MAESQKPREPVSKNDIRAKLGTLEFDEAITYLEGEFEKTTLYDPYTLNNFVIILDETIRNQADRYIEDEKLYDALKLLEEQAQRNRGKTITGRETSIGHELYLYAISRLSLETKMPKKAIEIYGAIGDQKNYQRLTELVNSAKEAAKQSARDNQAPPESDIEKAVNKKGIPTITID